MTTRSEIIEVMGKAIVLQYIMLDGQSESEARADLDEVMSKDGEAARALAQAALQALETVGLVDFSDKELGSSGAESGGTASPKSDGPHALDWETAPLGETLWGVYGPDCFPTIFACQMKDSPVTGRCLWGFSIYMRQPRFRTLGVGKEWAAEKELRLYAERAEAFEDIAALFKRADS